MSQDAFDAVTRRAADGLSRRASLVALGGAALAASLAEPAIAKKNRKNKGKTRRKIKKRVKKQVEKQVQQACESQVEPCRTFFSGLCFGDPFCEAEVFPCCDHLAQCDSAAVFQCLFSCGCDAVEFTPQQPS